MCLSEQIQESEWILSCQSSPRLKLKCTKDPCCHLFCVEGDIVTEFARQGALSELPHADVLVQMNDTIKGFRKKFLN